MRLFHGPFFIQTLATHYTIISGAVKVKSMDPYAFKRMPFATIGISAAVVFLICFITLTCNTNTF